MNPQQFEHNAEKRGRFTIKNASKQLSLDSNLSSTELFPTTSNITEIRSIIAEKEKQLDTPPNGLNAPLQGALDGSSHDSKDKKKSRFTVKTISVQDVRISR